MGQKSNFLTLKPSFININLQTFNPKFFLYGTFFLIAFKKFLLKKNIILIKPSLNLVGNQMFLSLVLFFKTAKIFYFMKKKLKKKLNLTSYTTKSSVFFNKLFNTFNLFKCNLFVLSIKSLNKILILKENKFLLKFFYKKTKMFLNLLFQRRFTLYFDFIKHIVLLIQGLISSQSFIQILGQLFRFLHKKKHTRFFIFFNLISNLILNTRLYTKLKTPLKIKGLKLLLKGRLQGKMRASSKYLQEGIVPAQSIDKVMEFSKLHICTIYGVFGLKLWIHKN